jgi:hypothetical protein
MTFNGSARNLAGKSKYEIVTVLAADASGNEPSDPLAVVAKSKSDKCPGCLSNF